MPCRLTKSWCQKVSCLFNYRNYLPDIYTDMSLGRGQIARTVKCFRCVPEPFTVQFLTVSCGESQRIQVTCVFACCCAGHTVSRSEITQYPHITSCFREPCKKYFYSIGGGIFTNCSSNIPGQVKLHLMTREPII